MNVKYLYNGVKVHLFCEIENGFLVQDILSRIKYGVNTEYIDDTIYFVKEIYDDPPLQMYYTHVEKYHKDIDRLKNQISELEARVEALRTEEYNTEHRIRNFTKKKVHVNFS